jgi:hypothetical protein
MANTNRVMKGKVRLRIATMMPRWRENQSSERNEWSKRDVAEERAPDRCQVGEPTGRDEPGESDDV